VPVVSMEKEEAAGVKGTQETVSAAALHCVRLTVSLWQNEIRRWSRSVRVAVCSLTLIDEAAKKQSALYRQPN
jgi:hypothetical protein